MNPIPPFIGHHKIWETLQGLYDSGRLPHALLFLGAEGIGKQKVARHLAAKILKMEGKNHPDLIWIEPEEGKIKIDTIRDLKKTFSFPPLSGDRRVVVLNDAHRMNAAAANALLKSLEEPPTGTYFFLITHALGWLPRTIVSRCQKFQFSPLNENDLRLVLKDLAVEIPLALLKWTQGSARKALQLKRVEEQVPSISSLLPSAKALDFDGAYTLAQAVTEEEVVPEFLQALLSSAHQYLIAPGAERRQEFDVLNYADRILEIHRLLRQNINPRIHLTRLLLYFQEPKESRL